VPGGWEPPPGDFQGWWKTSINYTGQVDFGNTVSILAGKYKISFVDGHSLSGRVTGGTVQWAANESADIGCGAGVALIDATLSLGRHSAIFEGCLHDIPVFSTLPMVWGVFLLE